MVLSLATILSSHGGLSNSIKVQTGTVNEYYDNLMTYAESIQITDSELLLSCFIDGLTLQIQLEVLCNHPKSILQAWFLARRCEINLEEEEQIQIQAKSKIQINHSNSTNSDHSSIPIPDQPTIQNRITETQQLTIPNQIVENINLEEVEDADLELATKRVNQPPPKPPDPSLYSSAEDGASARGMWTSSMAAGRTTPATAEDEAAAMEDRAARLETESSKMVVMSEVSGDGKDADLSCSNQESVVNVGPQSSAEVGASARGKWSAATVDDTTRQDAYMEETRRTMAFHVDGAPTVTGGVFQDQSQRPIVSPIVANPHPLIAAVFPWNRGVVEERSLEGWQWTAESHGVVMVVKCGAEETPGSGTCMAPWRGGRGTVEVVAFFTLDAHERLGILEASPSMHQRLKMEEWGELLPLLQCWALKKGI